MPVYEMTAEEMLGGSAVVAFAGSDSRFAQKFICPKCKQKSGVTISYGYPGDEMQGEAERNEIVLGGCVQEEGAPDRQCLSCGHQWLIVRRRNYLAKSSGTGPSD